MMSDDQIANILNRYELLCIVNDFKEYSFDVKKELENCIAHKLSDALRFIFECIAKSDYEAVLQLDLRHYGFTTSTINFDRPDDFICDVLKDDNDTCCQIKAIILMFIAVSSLQEFIRSNFCGPRHKVDKYNIVSFFIPDNEITDSKICSLLSLDGESVYPHVINPKLLYLSSFLLTYAKNHSSFTQKWWLLRSTFIHQLILPEKSEFLHSTMISLITDVYQTEWLNREENVTKRLIFSVECCHIFLHYGEILQARRYLRDAQSITGLEIELSGAMGKRTQYQKKAVAQLFVKIKRNHFNFTGTVPDKKESFPVDLHLQDEVVLNKVAMIDDNEYDLDNLFAEEQTVLLGHCCLVQRSSSFDELLQEELMSYINCLLSQPQVWPIYLKALIMRCKTEKNSSRRIERAVMQMEAIVDSVKKVSPPLNEREKLFYCTSFPAYWILEKELADLLFSIGCTKSALEIYERLELWEDIIKCYVRLGRTSSAEKVILNQLEKGETPMLWCLLGDVTENTEHYLKAWELSKHRSARAQRSLGYYYFQRKEYEKSLPYFISSLEINHLQPQVWFSAGHAATQAENFEYAARAYRQVVMFDEDNFEAWNNLANAYIKTKQKIRAWRSLQEALKCNYEEWRVWENFLLVSTDVGAFEDALRAWHRLLDIKGKHCDTLLLEILVNAIVKDLSDINGYPSSRLNKKTLELLGRITSITTNEPKVWELYATLANSNAEEITEKDMLEKVALYLQKAVRSYNQRGSWERDFNQSKEMLSCSIKLGEISLSYIKLLEGNIKNQQKTSARLNLQSIIARSKKFLDFFPPDQKCELDDMLEVLQNFLNDIINL